MKENKTQLCTADEKAEVWDKSKPDNKLGVGLDKGVGKLLANETAYYQEGTWYLDSWVPGVKMVLHEDQEWLEEDSGCGALLSGTILTNIRVVKTQGWEQPKVVGIRLMGCQFCPRIGQKRTGYVSKSFAECRWNTQRWQEEEKSTWMVVAVCKNHHLLVLFSFPKCQKKIEN